MYSLKKSLKVNHVNNSSKKRGDLFTSHTPTSYKHHPKRW